MPITHTVEPENCLVKLCVSGRLTVVESLAAVDEVVADPLFEPGYGILSDHRAIEEPATPELIRAMIGHMQARAAALGAARMAVIVSHPASFGMMRMLQARAEGIGLPVRIFKDETAARRWLATPA